MGLATAAGPDSPRDFRRPAAEEAFGRFGPSRTGGPRLLINRPSSLIAKYSQPLRCSPTLDRSPPRFPPLLPLLLRQATSFYQPPSAVRPGFDRFSAGTPSATSAGRLADRARLPLSASSPLPSFSSALFFVLETHGFLGSTAPPSPRGGPLAPPARRWPISWQRHLSSPYAPPPALFQSFADYIFCSRPGTSAAVGGMP